MMIPQDRTAYDPQEAMVNLHLCVPKGASSALEDGQQLAPVMDEIHLLLKTALLEDRSNRHELWMWLVNYAAHLPVPDNYADRKTSVLTSLLPSSFGSQPQQLKAPCRRLLRLLCEARPQEVSELILRHKPELYAALFTSDGGERAALEWFDHFGTDGVEAFRFGAKALAKFALNNRDQVWEELVWEGAHAHAPVVLVAKPHYWRQLRVAPSVAGLARCCPHFWRSAEFGACLAGGHILAVDLEYFARELHRVLGSGGAGAGALERLLRGFVEAASWKQVMQPLLPLLPESELLRCLTCALPSKPAGAVPLSVYEAGELALQEALYSIARFRTLDDLLLSSALALQSKRVLHMLRDEDARDLFEAVVANAMKAATCSSAGHWQAVLQGDSRTRALRRLVLQLFAARCQLDASLVNEAALRETCLQNGICLSDVSSPGPAAMGDESAMDAAASQDARVGARKRKKGDKEQRNKGSSKSRRMHKRKERRRGDDSDDDGSAAGSGLQEDSRQRVELRFNNFVDVCTLQDAPEALHMLAVCVRMREWWKAHVP